MRLLIVPLLSVVWAAVEAHNYVVSPMYEYRTPAAPLSSDGRVIDTPEVAQARAAHLAVHAETVARLRETQTEESGMMMRTRSPPPMMMMMRQQREQMLAPVGKDGRVVDTPEVAQAKAAHMAAHARAAKSTAQYDLNYNRRQNLIYVAPVRVAYTHIVPIVRYQGPPAPLGPDGRVVDTPEVARAREAHMKAHARAVALMAQMHGDYD